MSKEFYISANRRVALKNQEDDYIIIIEEIGSELKTIRFPAKRWAQLVAFEYYIDQNINKLLGKVEKVSFQAHIGGGMRISNIRFRVREYQRILLQQKQKCPVSQQKRNRVTSHRMGKTKTNVS
jgi:hypothetical protein